MTLDPRLNVVHVADMRAELGRFRRGAEQARSAASEREIVIRLAVPDDDMSLARLFALDSQEPRRGAWLLCEVDGQLAAAVRVSDGRVVADPFRRTSELIELLRVRARHLGGARRRRARWGMRVAHLLPAGRSID
jgi:hypothetical protein